MHRHVDLIESSHAYKELRSDCAAGHLKHAYVFESADFDALDTLASLFICLCEKGRPDGPMVQRIIDDSYLDVVRLPAAEKKGKMDVEEVSRMTDSAYLMPTELTSKYYIVSASEPLSAAVQNKMLKTLEEPPASARFIIFSAGGDLLPTVTSRCSRIRLESFPVETVQHALMRAGFDEVTALFASAVSRGNIGSAEKIAADPGYRYVYEAAMNFLLTVKRSPQILPAVGELSAYKDKYAVFVDYLEIILRDVVAYTECGAQAIILKPAASEIRTLARELDVRTVLCLMPLLTHARERMRLYGNAVGVIDELLFSILEVKAKCLKS